jgi:adenine-specific DNA-methyltransferase
MAKKLELSWPGKDDGHVVLRDEITGEPQLVRQTSLQLRLLLKKEVYDPASHQQDSQPEQSNLHLGSFDHHTNSSHANGHDSNNDNGHGGSQIGVTVSSYDDNGHRADALVSSFRSAADAASSDSQDDNLLIQGENLHVLRTLLKRGYKGKVRLIYIDPPFNTGRAFSHYNDGLEHTLWLTMMQSRLRLLKEFLREDGSIWVHLDDNEAHYCRVLMDEIFERRNFLANVLWQKVYSPKNTARHFSTSHDHILVYARDINEWQRNSWSRKKAQNDRYENADNDPRGPWKPGGLDARNYYSLGDYPIHCPGGRVIAGPPAGSYWRVSQQRFRELDEDCRIWWGKDANGVPAIKRFLSEVMEGIVPQTIWFHVDVGHTQEAKKEMKALFPGSTQVFDTAKPERLLRRIIEMASDPGDLVLDCFLGSGTTAAVAHKLGRRWIGIESGPHARTLALERLKKVVNGTDQGGISRAVPPHVSRMTVQANMFGAHKKPVGWTGGGSFSFYTLGKAILDKHTLLGIWTVNYGNGALIEAVCLSKGFKLTGHSLLHGMKGRHFAHVTDQYFSPEYATLLTRHPRVDGEHLTVYCFNHAEDMGGYLPSYMSTERLPEALRETVDDAGVLR